MIKPFLPALSYYYPMAAFAKSKWALLVFLLPVIPYLVFLKLETELTHFIIPFFPDEPDKSFAFYRDFLRLCFNEMLWLTLFFLLTWLLALHIPLNKIVIRIEKGVLQNPDFYASLIIGISFLATLLISNYTLDRFPNSADEYVYLHQAETLGQGKLWHRSHPLFEFFHFNHIAHKEGIQIGRFPPGWPLLLSTAFIFDFPVFLVNPLIGLISLIFFYRFTTLYYNRRIAIWALIALALSGFYIFNSASYFSHTTSLLFTLGFAYFVFANNGKPSGTQSLIAGAFMGLNLITRYYTAVLIFTPVFIYLLYQNRTRVIPILFWIGIGCLPFLIFLFWYNYKITGNGFLPVTMWIDREEALGFVHGHTVMTGVEHIIRRVFMFLYWSSPALLILYVVFLFRKIREKNDRLMHPGDYFFILLTMGYFFYHHIGGNQYGPRFMFEALPFLLVFITAKVFQVRSKWVLALFMAGLIYCVVKLPSIVQREHQVVAERQDVYRIAAEKKLTNAVVLLSSHTGVIRPMPVTDLTRNNMDFDGNVIYAIYKPGEIEKIRKFYPDRSFYKYVKDLESAKGKLEKLK